MLFPQRVKVALNERVFVQVNVILGEGAVPQLNLKGS